MILRIVWLVLLAMSISLPAVAAPTAVELAQEAKVHYDRGEWSEALALFQQAETVAHSPVLVLYAARCERNLGKLLAARTLLEKVAAETLPAGAPAPFANAQRDAKVDLEALTARIPKITIDRSQAPADWIVELDGMAVTAASMPVDPGSHVVSAKDTNGERFREDVTIAEATTVTVTVLETAQQPAPSPVPAPAPDAPSTETPSSAAELAPGLTLIGVGSAALAVGIVLRVLAIGKIDDVKSRCVNGSCQRADEAVVDEAVTFETASTVLFIAGGAVAATGIVLVLVLPGSSSTALELRPTHIGLRGSF